MKFLSFLMMLIVPWSAVNGSANDEHGIFVVKSDLSDNDVRWVSVSGEMHQDEQSEITIVMCGAGISVKVNHSSVDMSVDSILDFAEQLKNTRNFKGAAESFLRARSLTPVDDVAVRTTLGELALEMYVGHFSRITGHDTGSYLVHYYIMNEVLLIYEKATPDEKVIYSLEDLKQFKSLLEDIMTLAASVQTNVGFEYAEKCKELLDRMMFRFFCDDFDHAAGSFAARR